MSNLIVQTKKGAVKGFRENGTRKWLGIPFAKPPVQELRFKRPVEPDPWDGVLECDHLSDSPYQFAGGMIGAMMKASAPQNEDCLYLNVWSPKKAKKCPVFIWIYGGANHIGDSANPGYDLTSFTKDGIVGVSFNYRVGPLGFYDFSKYTDEFDTNCAVADMILALKWVHENIEAFGGDPDNVTICGESAGGTGVLSLMSSPVAQDYFHRAIPMSALAANITNTKANDQNNELFFKVLGIDPKTDIGRLKEMSVEELKKGSAEQFVHPAKEYPGILISGPVTDDLIADRPWKAMDAGVADGKAMLMGTCKDEGTLFYMMSLAPKSWKEVEQMLRLSGREEVLSRLKEVYPKKEKEAMQQLAKDRLFWVDDVRCALAQSKHAEVYMYRYDFTPLIAKMVGLNATHSVDINSGLDTWKGGSSTFEMLNRKKTLKKVHRNLHGAFVNFVKTGDPNGEGLPEWKPFEPENRYTMSVSTTCQLLEDPRREIFEAWAELEDLYQ